jgi:NAD-dependent dihydropyrimidine dehydrogenase PreA subunit
VVASASTNREVERAVATYDDIRRFVETTPGPFAALHCICRQGKDFTGEPCRQTKERRNCLLFDAVAERMTKRVNAREVTRDEMLRLVEQADRDGLVLEPQNTREPLFVCCCCGCCCGVLTTAKKVPRPANFFQTGFIAEVERDACLLCGACESRCQMDAITSGDEPASVAEERCIGCGLCVTTCPSGALRLRRKEGQKPPPKDVKDLYMTMFKERFGRLGTATVIAGHLVGRKF